MRWMVIVSVLGLASAGCERESPPLRTHPGLYIPEDDPAFRSAEPADDTIRLTFDGLPSIDPREAAFVAGSQGDGYLRRVVSGTRDGDGRYVLTTEPAALSDVIESGRMRLLAGQDDVSVVEGDVGATREPLRAVVDLNETLLEDTAGGVPVTVRSRGEIVFTPDATLDVTFRDFDIEGLEASVQASIRLELDVEATVGGAVTRSGSTELAGPSFPIRGAIGPLPVVGRAEIVLVVGYEASAVASGTVSMGISVTTDASATVLYEDGEWTDESTGEVDATPRGPTWTVEANASLRAYVRPVLRFVLYGVGGPSFALERSAAFSGTFRPCPPRWSMRSGVAAEATIEGAVRILTFERDFSYELARVERAREIGSGMLDDPACGDGGMDAGEQRRPDAETPDADTPDADTPDAGPDAGGCGIYETDGGAAEPRACSCSGGGLCPSGTICARVPYNSVCCPPTGYVTPGDYCDSVTCPVGYVRGVSDSVAEMPGGELRQWCVCMKGSEFPITTRRDFPESFCVTGTRS